jgi:hypothetical protein
MKAVPIFNVLDQSCTFAFIYQALSFRVLVRVIPTRRNGRPRTESSRVRRGIGTRSSEIVPIGLEH